MRTGDHLPWDYNNKSAAPVPAYIRPRLPEPFYELPILTAKITVFSAATVMLQTPIKAIDTVINWKISTERLRWFLLLKKSSGSSFLVAIKTLNSKGSRFVLKEGRGVAGEILGRNPWLWGRDGHGWKTLARNPERERRRWRGSWGGCGVLISLWARKIKQKTEKEGWWSQRRAPPARDEDV